jgi:hypothetical protein
MMHDWIGPTRTHRYVHCARCGKNFEILKAKGECHECEWVSADVIGGKCCRHCKRIKPSENDNG